MNDYGEATYYLAGPWFAERGVAIYAYDARGFGRSPNRGVWGGERLMTEDLRTAIDVARRAPSQRGDRRRRRFHGRGHHDRHLRQRAIAPNADRIILVAPAVWGWSTMPDAYALTLWTGAHTFPWRAVHAAAQRRAPHHGVGQSSTCSGASAATRTCCSRPASMRSTAWST